MYFSLDAVDESNVVPPCYYLLQVLWWQMIIDYFECYHIARLYNDIYNCAYDSLVEKCNSSAADLYGDMFIIGSKRQLAAINCTIGKY